MGYKDPPEEYKWKKGQSGNPSGRPKGQTLKQYAAQKFRDMSAEEKEEFLKEIAKDLQWRMSEGNPATESEIEHKGTVAYIPLEIMDKHGLTQSPEEDSEG